MPVYNAGNYLTNAVESIRANACESVELEILLIDDCSTDPTTRTLLTAYESVVGVLVLRQSVNGGPSKARNMGMRAATGDWIGFLDADDLFAESSIALRRDAIAALPAMQWMASDMLEMRAAGELTHYHSFKVGEKNAEPVLPGMFRIKSPTREMVGWLTLPSLGSMLIRRDLLAQLGFFGEDLFYGEDVHFCLLATTYADLYWIDKPCLYIRRYHESMTKDSLRMACESPRYTGRLLREPRLQMVRKQLRWQHAASLRHMSKVALMHNHRWRAFYSALLSLFWTPNSMKSLQLAVDACLPKRGA